MRKRIWSGVLGVAVLISIFPAPTTLHAGYARLLGTKMVRGFQNIIVSPAEIPCAIHQGMLGEDYVWALPKGVVVGSAMLGRRLVVGAYELVTFSIPQNPVIESFTCV